MVDQVRAEDGTQLPVEEGTTVGVVGAEEVTARNSDFYHLLVLCPVFSLVPDLLFLFVLLFISLVKFDTTCVCRRPTERPINDSTY